MNRGARVKAWFKSLFSNLSYFVFWLILTGLSVFTVFQLHATLIASSIKLIENPDLRPVSWTMDTVHGLGRVFWLVLGILWLGWVIFTEGHLREGIDRDRLMVRFFVLLLVLAAVYGLSYLALLSLS